MLQVRDAEKFLRHLVSKAGIHLLDSKQGPHFKAFEEDGSDKRLVEFKLACKADGVAHSDVCFYPMDMTLSK